MSALRAKTIRDLINHDSKFAEVNITIDTPDGEHQISRKIDREGNSTYILNGKKTTRANIIELLKRYNIENGTHNVIGQGEVQRIIDMSPIERRKMIDEIAGISEFDDKKKEALKELDTVQERINNMRIILKEKEGNLEQLKKEREDAQKYLELKKRINNLKNSILKIRIEETEQKLDKILKEYSETKLGIEDIERQIEQLSKKIREKTEEINEISKEINARTTNNKIYQRYEQLEKELAVSKERKDNLIIKRSELKRRIEELNSKREEIKGRIDYIEEEIKPKGAEIDKLKAELKEIRDRIESTKQKESSLLEESKRLGEEIKNREKELEGIQNNYIDLQGEISKLKSMIQTKETELEELGGVDETAEINRIRDIEKEIAQLEKEKERVKKERENIFNRERKVNERIKNVETTLVKSKSEFSRYKGVFSHIRSEGVINFIRKLRDENKVQGIYGTVEELCSFDPKYATAIESAVGGRLNYVVVENLDVARELVEILRRNKIGKTTFLPLRMNLPPVKSGSLNFPGVMGKLMDFITFDPKFSDPIRYAFGDTVLITDIETAKDVGLVGKARLVTIDGDLIEKSSAVTGGYHVSGMRLAERKKAVELEKKIEALQLEKEALMQELYGIREKSARIRQELAEIDNKIRAKKTDIEIISKRGEEVKRRMDRAKQVKEELVKLRKELKERERSLNEYTAKIEGLHKAIDELKIKKEQVDRKILEKTSEDQDKVSRLMETLSKLESEYNSKRKEIELLNEKLKEIQKEVQESEDKFEGVVKEIDEIEKRIEEIEKEKIKIKKDLEIADKETRDLMEKRNNIQREVDQLSYDRGKLSNKRDSLIKMQFNLEKDKALLEQKLVDYKGAFTGNEEEFEFIEGDVVKMEAELRRVQREIEPMEGSINLRALTLYDQKKEEIEEVKLKLEKLENEREAVINMIKEVEKRKYEVFMEAFNKVNESFKNLFKQTFKRGDAELVLMNPEDPFSGGLDVKLNFFGKRPERIEALSGGQKSIIGLLLVFALHMYKPSAFYILDEVEAALDKANSRYVAELVSQLSKQTQFIVVSHNDTVISSAEAVMGVTKGKNGSVIVGLKLKDKPIEAQG